MAAGSRCAVIARVMRHRRVVVAVVMVTLTCGRAVMVFGEGQAVGLAGVAKGKDDCRRQQAQRVERNHEGRCPPTP